MRRHQHLVFLTALLGLTLGLLAAGCGPGQVQLVSVTANPVSVRPGGTAEITCTARNAVAFSWSADRGTLVSDTGNPVSWTAPGSVGTATITVLALGADGSAVSGAVSVPITSDGTGSSNRAPEITALTADPASVPTSGTASLACTLLDPDGDPLTVTWSAAAGTLRATTGNPVSWIAPATAATVTITATVSDGRGGTATRTASITVTTAGPPPGANHAPVISALTANPASVATSGTAQLTATASDADNDTITYAWSATSGTLRATTGNPVSWVAPGTATTATIKVIATDEHGSAATRTVAVGVTGGNPPNPGGYGSEFIYGIHTYNSGASGIMNGKTGYCLDYFPNSSDTNINNDGNSVAAVVAAGFTPILRVDYRGGGHVSPKNSTEYAEYASECAARVNQYKSQAKIWSLGNEMNCDWEGSIAVQAYVDGFKAAYAAMKAADSSAIVLVGPPGPWNPGVTGNYQTYLQGIVQGIGNQCDGYTIHAYGGRGGDSNATDDGESGFGVFETQANIIRQYGSTTKPIYITEFNHVANGGNPPPYPYGTGLIPTAYARINSWNQTHGNQIKALCWFTYRGTGGWSQWAQFSLEVLTNARNDFSSMTAGTNYRNR